MARGADEGARDILTAVINEQLRAELLAMRAEDLRVRADLEAAGRLRRGYDREMEAVHRRNAARLRDLLAEHGWPVRHVAGEDGAEAAWLIVQHAIAEPDFQRRALPLLAAAGDRGEIPAWQPAFLTDRIRMFEGWPQVYGTQMAPDHDGRMAPWPIVDRAGLDERRRTVGLPPFNGRRTGPPGLPDESGASRAEMDAWVRRTGWRRRILHLAAAAEWAAALRGSRYAAASLGAEGFIHCSEPQQVIRVANGRFAGRRDLLLLQIDVSRVTADGRYENLEGGDELFPHIYGPLDFDAIVRVSPFPCRPDGTFDDDQLGALY